MIQSYVEFVNSYLACPMIHRAWALRKTTVHRLRAGRLDFQRAANFLNMPTIDL
jgi:hypothetical protein